jgi:hypothetical protein
MVCMVYRVVTRNMERKTRAASDNRAALLADSTLPSVLQPTGYRPRSQSREQVRSLLCML